MLVGKIDVAVKDLLTHIATTEEFIEYADSLIPDEFKHIQTIIDNQRYVNCLVLRTATMVSWEKKNAIIENVMKNISITGYTSLLVEVGTLYGLINRERMESFDKRRK